MKSVFWKISAVVAILLSSLGPHVAQGTLEFQVASETGVTSGPDLRVVSSTSQAEISLAKTSVCGDAALSFDRFDLLLWNNCNFNLSLGKVSAPELAVVTELPELPNVIVLRSESNQLSHHAEFWNSQSQPDAAIIAYSLLNTHSSTVSSPASSIILSQVELAPVGTDSSQKYIVMRC